MVTVPDLQTQGYPKWYQGWDRPVTAHPKVDPETNEMMFFGFDVPAPHAVYGVLSPEGKLVHKADLKFERVTFMHDMAITRNFTVLLDLPLTFNTERLKQGKPLIDFETDSFARIGVMPRYGDAESIQWFKADIGYSFHVLNAYEDGEEVILHAMRSRSIGLTPPRGMSAKEYFVRGITPSQPETVDDPLLDGGLIVNLHEWRLNLTTGESTERMLSDWRVSGDFPRLNEGYQGRKHKYGYVAVHDLEASRAAALPKYGGIGKFHIPSNADPSELPIRMEHHSFGPGRFGGEPVFVPRPEGKDEDDGWLVTYVYDENTNESEMYIIDAKEFDKASPTARIKLPQRVPYGFHGQWIPAQ
jgi:carotenoid cleavage dioxygenase